MRRKETTCVVPGRSTQARPQYQHASLTSLLHGSVRNPPKGAKESSTRIWWAGVSTAPLLLEAAEAFHADAVVDDLPGDAKHCSHQRACGQSAAVRSTSTSWPENPSRVTPRSVLAVVNADPMTERVSWRQAAARTEFSSLTT
jgi:hypothetical protein